jgi:hypothetical protein
LVSKYQGIATNVSFVNQSAGWRISDNLVWKNIYIFQLNFENYSELKIFWC